MYFPTVDNAALLFFMTFNMVFTIGIIAPSPEGVKLSALKVFSALNTKGKIKGRERENKKWES